MGGFGFFFWMDDEAREEAKKSRNVHVNYERFRAGFERMIILPLY